jgi:glucose/arabinose dehydrogenase
MSGWSANPARIIFCLGILILLGVLMIPFHPDFPMQNSVFHENLIIHPTDAVEMDPDMYHEILDKISLPDGFHINIYATHVPGARSLSYSKNRTLYIGTRGDKVYAVRDSDGDGFAENRTIIASDLTMPNGVAILEDDLYVAEISRIIKFPGIEMTLPDIPDYEILYAGFPKDTAHGWKFIRFGPDGKLYIPVGAPCNICLPPGDFYAAIHRINPDGTSLEKFASGVRNTVGFDWDPKTGDLWFTDNGRDMLGDNVPPDELNHAPTPKMFFGYPYLHGGNIIDPEFGDLSPDGCKNCTPPARELGPHVASLGMRFYTGEMFPDSYTNAIIIAEHGSWNRKDPIGYRLTIVQRENGIPVSYEPFIEGWLHNGTVYGRPVDVEVIQDGSLLISDDMNGIVYRVWYNL